MKDSDTFMFFGEKTDITRKGWLVLLQAGRTLY